MVFQFFKIMLVLWPLGGTHCIPQHINHITRCHIIRVCIIGPEPPHPPAIVVQPIANINPPAKAATAPAPAQAFRDTPIDATLEACQHYT
jgi:hypothetical protein